MFRTSMLLILLSIRLTVTEGRYNSSNEEYKISDEGEVSDFAITQAHGRRSLQVPIENDPSSRIGLASQVGSNSFVGTPVMTPRKTPSFDDPSINEIDSADHFPPNTIKTSTTTEKPNIVWGLFVNSSGIVPGPNNRDDGSEIESLTSTTTSAPAAPDTRVTVPEHPTSLAEFINAQLSLLASMWTNFFKLTDNFSREIIDTVFSVLDFLLEIMDTVSSVLDSLLEIIELIEKEGAIELGGSEL